jgi:hypothetical protein
MGHPHNSAAPHIMCVTGPSQGNAVPLTKRGPSAGLRRVSEAYARNRYSETLEKGRGGADRVRSQMGDKQACNIFV